MLRSHDVAYDFNEEEKMKVGYADMDPTVKSERLLLFLTIHEALQFCEQMVIQKMGTINRSLSDRFLNGLLHEARQSLAGVFSRILSSSPDELNVLSILDGMRYHTEINFDPGDQVFVKGGQPDGLCVVLLGAVAIAIEKDDPRSRVHRSNRKIVSGAGLVQQRKSSSALIEPSFQDDDEVVVTSVWPVGGIFGYVDFLLDRPRNYTAVATQEGTVVAKMTKTQIQLMRNENPALEACLQRVLLQASLLDLANCSCDE